MRRRPVGERPIEAVAAPVGAPIAALRAQPVARVRQGRRGVLEEVLDVGLLQVVLLLLLLLQACQRVVRRLHARVCGCGHEGHAHALSIGGGLVHRLAAQLLLQLLELLLLFELLLLQRLLLVAEEEAPGGDGGEVVRVLSALLVGRADVEVVVLADDGDVGVGQGRRGHQPLRGARLLGRQAQGQNLLVLGCLLGEVLNQLTFLERRKKIAIEKKILTLNLTCC